MANPKNILITGASGLIGSRLTDMLLERGYNVSHLGRKKQSGKIKSFVWNVDRNIIEPDAFDGVDAIIHLAGAPVAEKRWTKSRKLEIINSRTLSTRLLHDTLQARKHNVKTVVSASAIGYYGFDREEQFTETSTPGVDFLAQVTYAWEQEADKIAKLGIRLVKVRVGIVLSSNGGAIKEMMKPIQYFVGSPLGNGNQYQSWIHIDDICGIFIKALEDETMNGAVNGAAPNPVTNRELTKAIAAALHRPLFLPPVPSFVLRLILGEMANIALKGSRVIPEKAVQHGYRFQFADVKDAVNDLLKKG
ncbi:TIGR01777 family oxidoreductase [Pseudochryseolinea flava]|uniref:TIGR01777 family protein n=1 Tax=Pseudochryseolinea flava TaxID=2059302 RepID=A0A364Y7S9_9BACT|nr:TIGR01777 family oxidoreductase [Pseudochryseolinea flava]RAW03037.1 TIGR01777 family protein [Pseudochryseolinea flava]